MWKPATVKPENGMHLTINDHGTLSVVYCQNGRWNVVDDYTEHEMKNIIYWSDLPEAPEGWERADWECGFYKKS